MPEITNAEFDPTDAELDAATEAYVISRWPQVKEWRDKYPETWNDTRVRIKAALIAAARVRADALQV